MVHGTTKNSENFNYEEYHNHLVYRLRREHMERRLADKETDEDLNELASVETSECDGIANSPLKITSVCLYPEKNATNHRTLKFQLVGLGTAVLRRGQSFLMGLKTDERQYDEKIDFVRIAFNFGPALSPDKGTQHNLLVESDLFSREDNSWGARIVGFDQNTILVEVRVSPDACVGIWTFTVETSLRNRKRQLYKGQEDVYILFNPWEKDDSTYMPDPNLLNEYVLEDRGKIWVGPFGSCRGRSWEFGQFDYLVLPLAIILLEKSGLNFSSRGNPILVSRALSKMINANEDYNGVICGRCDGEYEGEQEQPLSDWTGSVPILEEYFQTLKPIKYGQCWVLAGVFVTIARAIGIPCRVVTNLVSAVDTNGTFTVDTYFDKNNEEYEYDPNNEDGGIDSVWKFHTWNDVWMARPDLPKGYGGWQAIDSSTPQITSEGIFPCGPASLEAVRKGQAEFAYDVPLILAGVNADYVKWKEDDSLDFGFTRISCDKYCIGKQILTKQPNFYDPTGDTDRQDVVSDYKEKEGSLLERLALYKAVRWTRPAQEFFQVPTECENDVGFELIVLDKVPMGEPLTVILRINNKSTQVRSVHAGLSAESVYSNGVRGNLVKKVTTCLQLQRESKEEMKLNIGANEYMDKLVEYGNMKIFVICHVDETKQCWSTEHDFQILKPTLNLEISPCIQAGKTGTVTFSFANPIKTKLTQCKINYEGPGLIRFGTLQLEDIPSGREFSFTYNFVPRTSGTQKWVATFTSKELIDIVGSVVVDVSP